ncbi:MAG TPA: hypothetical protein VLW55_10900 [Burkholderiaceae bacterium]|nr:hypothetical protein [Burkholderiaceae bacterium]
MDKLDVSLTLEDVHCFDEADGPGRAEPYLWTVFFKIDGDTTFVDTRFTLQGTATVVTTRGNHRDLPDHEVGAGETVLIPPALGVFDTTLKPIPLQQAAPDGTTEVGGVVGVVTVLLEQDNTPDSAIAKGHRALNKAVRDALNELIPTLNFAHREPTEDDIEALKKKIGDKVQDTISDNTSIFDWLNGLGNMDDSIGSEVFRFSHTELAARGVSGISFNRRFTDEGDWKIEGIINAIPEGPPPGDLRVVLLGVPNDLEKYPVLIQGPGFLRSLNRTQTLVGLVPGTYNIIASGFGTGKGKSCLIHTPDVREQQLDVTSGRTASVTITYTAESCDLKEDRTFAAAIIA